MGELGRRKEMRDKELERRRNELREIRKKWIIWKKRKLVMSSNF